MTRPVVRYPKGGGGHWLNHLVWHLENADWNIIPTITVYDEMPQGSLTCVHWAEFAQDGSVGVMYERNNPVDNNIVFSTTCKFNIYLNLTVKSRFAYHRVDKLDLVPQVFDLSNTSRFVFENSQHEQYYCQVIDLDYKWLFVDKPRFVDALFEILRQQDIEFVANRSYAYACIDNYIKSVLNPADIIDNEQSTVWAGWCHAMSLINNIELPGQLIDCKDMKSVFQLLSPAIETARTLALDNCFTWKNENTTQ